MREEDAFAWAVRPLTAPERLSQSSRRLSIQRQLTLLLRIQTGKHTGLA